MLRWEVVFFELRSPTTRRASSCVDDDRNRKFEQIRDNLDRERWFRLPKSDEMRIHGRCNVGVPIVLARPTLPSFRL
jgi:hypothetical protein